MESREQRVVFAPPALPQRAKNVKRSYEDHTVSRMFQQHHSWLPAGESGAGSASQVSSAMHVSTTTGRVVQTKNNMLKLSSLGLMNREVIVKNEATKAHLAKGIVTGDGRIRVTHPSRFRSDQAVTAEYFVRKVAGINGEKSYWAHIEVVDPLTEEKKTLDDLRKSFDKEVTNAKTIVKDALRSANIQDEDELEAFSIIQNKNLITYANTLGRGHSDLPVAFHLRAYRVLRVNEDASQGIVIPAGQNPPAKDKLTKPAKDAFAFNFFDAMSGHISSASRQATSSQRKFISASGDLVSALSWGGFGLQKIAVIDLVKCAEEEVTAWHMGSVHQQLITTGSRTVNFAKASDEIVFGKNISKAAVSELRVEWEHKHVITFANKQSKTSKSRAPGQSFPERLNLSDVKVIEVKETASTRPFLVEINGRKYILKLGGRGPKRSSHVETEFFANVCYNLANIDVAPVALYIVNVVANDGFERQEIPGVCVLLSKYIETSREVKPEDYPALRKGVAMDLALANFDICGPNFNNLIVGKLDDGKEKVYRIDQGGCFEHNPNGTSKAGFDSSSDSLLSDIESFCNPKSHESSHQKRVEAFYDKGENARDSFRQELKHSAKAIMVRFEEALNTWMRDGMHLFPDWNEKYSCLISRLRLLAGTSLVPVGFAIKDLNILVEEVPNIRAIQSVSSSSSSVAASSPSSPSRPLEGDKKFFDIEIKCSKNINKGNLMEAHVVDVTSRSQDFRTLSPFFAHGGFKVPFLDYTTSESVEGIWQGLKIFENEDIDKSKFKIKNETNFKRRIEKLKSSNGEPDDSDDTHNNLALKRGKRGEKRRGNILGHRGPGGEILNPVGKARRLIYLPCYEEQLKRCTKEIDNLRRMASEKKLVLLDYNTSSDLDSTKPLSHAQLIKEFILEGTLSGFGTREAQSPPAKVRRKQSSSDRDRISEVSSAAIATPKIKKHKLDSGDSAAASSNVKAARDAAVGLDQKKRGQAGY